MKHISDCSIIGLCTSMRKTLFRKTVIVFVGLIGFTVGAMAQTEAPKVDLLKVADTDLEDAKKTIKSTKNKDEQRLKIKAAIAKARTSAYAVLSVSSDKKAAMNQTDAKKQADDEEKARKLLIELDEMEAGQMQADQAGSFFDPANWAIGLAMMKNRPTIVSEAEVDAAGVVRAKTIETSTARLMLIRQYYVSKKSSACWTFFCPGVFVGVGVGGGSNSQVIDAIGGGILWGSNDNTGDAESGRKHNFGIGWGRRYGVKLLDESYVPGQPAPGGSKTVPYQTRDINVRPFLMYSYKF